MAYDYINIGIAYNQKPQICKTEKKAKQAIPFVYAISGFFSIKPTK